METIRFLSSKRSEHIKLIIIKLWYFVFRQIPPCFHIHYYLYCMHSFHTFRKPKLVCICTAKHLYKAANRYRIYTSHTASCEDGRAHMFDWHFTRTHTKAHKQTLITKTYTWSIWWLCVVNMVVALSKRCVKLATDGASGWNLILSHSNSLS